MNREAIFALARSVMAGKPRSYVEAARTLAFYVLTHQLAFPGWLCASCRVFNGEEKETRTHCRSCNAPRHPTP